MANNVINTRIQLKVDTLTNWQTNNPVLLDGEIAIAKIDIVDPANKHLQPAMIKVGDGTSTFNQLDWTSAKAADVYEWAKASTKPEYNFEELKNIPAFITPDELENYYTKEEIDTKLSSVYRFKGNVQTLNDLPTEDNTPGDVYNIEENSSLTVNTEIEVPGLRLVTFHLNSNDGETFWLEAHDYETNTVVTPNVDFNVKCWGASVTYDEFTWDYTETFPMGGDHPYYKLATEEPYASAIYYAQISEGCSWDDGYNGSATITESTEITVKAGDNVAWTGSIWDVLAGTFEIDLSNYVTNDNVVNSVNGKKGNVTLTTQDLYEHFTIDENTGLNLSRAGGIYDFTINNGGINYQSISGDTATFEVNTEGLVITNDDPMSFVDIILKD